jgi:hypothetical protein
MIRPLVLTDSYVVNGLGISEESVTARRELSDYLYLVADCLTVVFHEAGSLGLSEFDLVATANRYLAEARTSLESVAGDTAGEALPPYIGAPDEILAVATALSRRAQLLEAVGVPGTIS